MPTPDFINPFHNILFIPLILRLGITLAVSFLLILASKKFSLPEVLRSNLGKRYIGWLILTPFYIAGVFLGRIPGLFVLLLFMILAIQEITEIAKLPTAYTYTLELLSVISLITASYFTQNFYMLPILYFMIITLVAIRRNDSQMGFFHAAVTLFYAIWIVFGLSHFVLLAHLSNKIDSTGFLLVLVIFAVSMSDVGAYVFGKFFHKIQLFDTYKIASNISPNKTYIGILGHILGAYIGIMILSLGFPKYISFYEQIILSYIIGIFGIMGGLTNSLFKRYFATKDSSHLIPGLGGVMDRIDSLVRVVVVLYYFLLFFH